MVKLDNDWLTTEPIDFEHKKYIMLAYEQTHTKMLDEKKLYPSMDDIIDKIKISKDFLDKVKVFENSKQVIDKIDVKKAEITRHSLINDKSVDEIKDIATFSKDILVDLYIKYRNFMDEVNENIVISGYCINFLDPYDGFIILKYGTKEKLLYYQVVRKIYPYPHFTLKVCKALWNEYYEMQYKKNVFDVIFKEVYPMKETSIPVFKKKFLLNLLGLRD